MKLELKPCPFCGKEAFLETDSDHHGGFFTLGCPDHDCPSHWQFYTEPIENLDKSVTQWNTRTELVKRDADADGYAGNEMYEHHKRLKEQMEGGE